MTGAAYASSSANAPPSSTFPATIASFGFTHQPNTAGSHDSATLPASGGLTAGRGCPVGDVAADRSPTLLPTSPEQQDELQETMSTPHPSHFQASSTPMVRQVSVTILLQLCGFLVWKLILDYFKKMRKYTIHQQPGSQSNLRNGMLLQSNLLFMDSFSSREASNVKQ